MAKAKILSPCCKAPLMKRDVWKGKCCSRCGYMCGEKTIPSVQLDIKK